ncbi:hypothetical protein RUND412_007815 [Rhizina undulata]
MPQKSPVDVDIASAETEVSVPHPTQPASLSPTELVFRVPDSVPEFPLYAADNASFGGEQAFPEEVKSGGRGDTCTQQQNASLEGIFDDPYDEHVIPDEKDIVRLSGSKEAEAHPRGIYGAGSNFKVNHLSASSISSSLKKRVPDVFHLKTCGLGRLALSQTVHKPVPPKLSVKPMEKSIVNSKSMLKPSKMKPQDYSSR